MTKSFVFLGLCLAALVAHTALASDPDLTTDFNVTNPNVGDFTLAGFGNVQPGGKGVATGTPAGPANLPGLSGLGLSAVLFEFGPVSQIDPHTHPRATEVFYVLTGQLLTMHSVSTSQVHPLFLQQWRLRTHLFAGNLIISIMILPLQAIRLKF
jgi:hypothetical protein